MPFMTTPTSSVRTRFAPSPTGALHGGTIRTTVFAWLIARQAGGQFLLRIEDTDQKREVAGAVDGIMDSLRWLGLTWDEGPDSDGPYGPYTQSQRLGIYKQWAQKLYDQGLAYADPYSPAELQALREQAQAEKRPFLYRQHRPEQPPAWDGSQPLRIRLEAKSHSWHDAVMGQISMGPEMVDDFIIIKSDGFPTYNFCHIIDDHLMKISHVTRSQEFLSSIPKFLAAHEVMGLTPPINVTVPPVLDETGKRKLSKRAGAKPILAYRDLGYLPSAIINFLATIGWNDGSEQEIFSLDELIAKFDVSRIQKSGGIFDEQRLLWLNGAHIRRLSLDQLEPAVANFWPASAAASQPAYKRQVLSLVHERLKFFAELPSLTEFFFTAPSLEQVKTQVAGNKQLRKLTAAEQRQLLRAVNQALAASDFSQPDLEARLRQQVEALGVKPGVLFSLIRVSLTGSNVAPGLFETLATIGKTVSLQRLQAYSDSL